MRAFKIRIDHFQRIELVYTNGIQYQVQAKLCFPTLDSNSYISLRDKSGKELEFIQSIHELDDDSIGALKSSLEKSYHLPEINRLKRFKLAVSFFYLSCEVEGSSRILVFERESDWAHTDSTLLELRDIYGDQYRLNLQFITEKREKAVLQEILNYIP